MSMSNAPLKSAEIRRLLQARSPRDLAEMYCPGMEVQINVGQSGGTRITKERGGISWQVWVNDDQTEEWKNYRLPRNANSTEPIDNDGPISFDHEKYVEAIGLSGWNYLEQKSYFFGFDFDSVVGHKAGLTEIELADVREAACNIPWITVRRSTSGTGLHLYIVLEEPIPAASHVEHAALARAVLGKMTSVTGYNFDAKVDVCGNIMWFWHKKMGGTSGLELLKTGSPLPSENIPSNWRDHIGVVSGKHRRVKRGSADMHDLIKQRAIVGLDEQHLKIIASLEGSDSYWDADNNVLVAHTYLLKQIHTQMGLRGFFDTFSTGKNCPHDTNCFCFPLVNGAFIIYRFGKGTKEHRAWKQDGSGWTYTYYNRDPDLDTIMRAYGAVETQKEGYLFKEAITAAEALQNFGIDMQVLPHMSRRNVLVSESRDGRIVTKIEQRRDDDNPQEMAEWDTSGNKYYTRMFVAPKKAIIDQSSATYDEDVRHIVSTGGDDLGWCVKAANSHWHHESLINVRLFMQHMGLTPAEIQYALGWAVGNPWRVVGRPFESEYPGGRDWNREAPQLAFKLLAADVDLHHPHWNSIFTHLGQSLDSAVAENEWCTTNQVYTGADYLKLWVACMLQRPTEPTPYLFFYGEQNTGKSIFHEALSMLLTSGYVRADHAMQSTNDFNGELLNGVLCAVEEIHLGRDKRAYARIKDWVTAIKLSVHPKGETPYLVDNSTHWCQFANDQDACPVFTGDKRITYIYVDTLKAEIPKRIMLAKLRDEASSFLTEVALRISIPESNGRLSLPPLKTQEMEDVQLANENALERFLRDKCFYAPGEYILTADFYEEFKRHIRAADPQELINWPTVHKVGREMPGVYSRIFSKKFVRGRVGKEDSAHAYGNIAFEQPKSESEIEYVTDGKFLRIFQRERTV